MRGTSAPPIAARITRAFIFNPDWEFLEHLRDVGREAAERWLAEHFDDLNRRSTVDIHDRYL